MLSQRLQVRPLKEGQVKVFKLVGNGEMDPATGAPRYNGGGHFAGYFTIYDGYEKDITKRKKILRNVTGTATVIKDGKEVLEEVVSDIEFNRQGICVVKHDEPQKLICLMRANENKSNPFRDKSKPPVWEELEPAETRKDILDKIDLEYRAETYVVNASMTDLVALAKKLTSAGVENFSLNKKSDELRYDLRLLAKRLPKEVLRNSKDKEFKMKIILDDAVKFLVLDFYDEENAWKWCEDLTPIVEVKAGQNPVEILMDHMLKDKESNQRLLAEINKTMGSGVEA